jgi:hypothetical protein
MTDLFHSYRRYNENQVGREYDVLICEMATDGIHYVGHNKCYEHILVPKPAERSLLGKWARVRVTEVSKFYMKSVIVTDVTSLGTRCGANAFWKNLRTSGVLGSLMAPTNSRTVRFVVIANVLLLLYFIIKTLLF